MYILFLVLASVSILLTTSGLFGLPTETALAQNQYPTVTLQRKVDSQNPITASAWRADDATIIVADQVSLRWSSTNASSCSGSANNSLHLFNTNSNTGGTDTSIYEPSAGTSTTYTIVCTDGINVATDSITVTKLPNPIAALGRKVSAGGWLVSDATINAGDEVSLSVGLKGRH